MIDFDAIQKEVDDRYISVQRHPTTDLRIFNYAAKAQYEWRWTPEIKACRGLIVDSKNNIMARPFEKFFSYDQLDGVIPNETFEVFDKLDGSLGILYWIDDCPFIATRGSFTSEQAIRATRILHTKYANIRFERGVTYCFEIIYPENRIVIDYGANEDLYLLAIIDNATGKDLPVTEIGMPTVKPLAGMGDVASMLASNIPNKEGYVLRFASGVRVKVKFEEYKRLHKLITGINERHVWEELAAGRSLEPILDRVPDEYFAWVREVEGRLRGEFSRVEAICKSEFKPRGDRKETAEYFKTCSNPPVLFSMLDNKDYSSVIWKGLRPVNVRAFRCDNDEI